MSTVDENTVAKPEEQDRPIRGRWKRLADIAAAVTAVAVAVTAVTQLVQQLL